MGLWDWIKSIGGNREAEADERDLQGWQSGLYYADQTPKPSLPSFRRTAAAVRDGTIAQCSD